MENIKDASDLPYCESSDNLFYLSEYHEHLFCHLRAAKVHLRTLSLSLFFSPQASDKLVQQL